MQSKATTVDAYLASLPADRRAIIAHLRKMILERLPEGYEEAMNWGMIAYQVPLTRYPTTYNGQPLMYAALASQKQHCSLYLSCAYQDSNAREKLLAAFERAGKKSNMGKSCIRFKTLDDLALPAIGREIARVGVTRFIKEYEAARLTYARSKADRDRVK